MESRNPAFMRVVADVDRKKSYNKYLLSPLVGGEIVKIHDNQSSNLGASDSVFQKQYIRILRKNAHGEWKDVFVIRVIFLNL